MVIDFHTHILPGLDHGCIDLQTALYQMKRAKSAGVDLMVASSHFYPHIDTVNDYVSRRKNAWEKLQPILSPELPRVLLGAEILVCEGMEKMKHLTRLSIDGSGTVLLEIPNVPLNYRLKTTLVSINDQCRGKAVLAHVDRYDENGVEALFERGLLGQINIGNLCRKQKHSTLMQWINEGKIVALGSDIHGKSGVYKKLSKAKVILGDKFFDIMNSSQSLL